MPMTFEALKRQLSAIEPTEATYSGITAAELPLLEQLLADDEAWMAARAVFAISRVPGARAMDLLKRSAVDPRNEVRVATAASITKVDPDKANGILLNLLDDSDVGVQKFAVQAVSGAHSAAVHTKLKALQSSVPGAPMRDIVSSKLRQLRINQ